MQKMPNTPELEAVYDLIVVKPEAWNQCSWVDDAPDATQFEIDPAGRLVVSNEVNICETTFCFAGHALLRAGFPVVRWGGSLAFARHDFDCDVEPVTAFEVLNSDEIHETARDLLGLTDREARRLFEAENDIDDIRRILDSIEVGYELDEAGL
jgi:hypothetical protein